MLLAHGDQGGGYAVYIDEGLVWQPGQRRLAHRQHGRIIGLELADAACLPLCHARRRIGQHLDPGFCVHQVREPGPRPGTGLNATHMPQLHQRRRRIRR